jgi:23S rRNA (pseudouridine1915-N3)-methyltransferase
VNIHLLAVGDRMPAWVEQGYRDYAKRLPASCRLVLRELAAGKRGKNAAIDRIMRDETSRLLAAVPKGAHVVALEVEGRTWTTAQLAERLDRWLASGPDVALLIGGPDGMTAEARERADELWSLSPLTLPHPLVRIVVAEQLYRAWSLLNNHPYHRA